jgi:hypothetical protein
MSKKPSKKSIIKRNKDIYDAIHSSVETGLAGLEHPYRDVLKEEFCGETWMWWMALVETDQIPQFATEHPEILTVNSFLELCGKSAEQVKGE